MRGFILIYCFIFANNTLAESLSSMMEKPVGHEYILNKSGSTSPSQRLHLILLGVNNLERSTKFYEGLGWIKSPTGNEAFVKFDLGGYALCLLSRKDFAKDAQFGSAEGTGFSGIGLVYLTKTPEEVPQILNRAVELGGTLLKPPTRTEWGIAGYFKDPDGHIFEVDYENTWVFDDDHKLVVDEAN